MAKKTATKKKGSFYTVSHIEHGSLKSVWVFASAASAEKFVDELLKDGLIDEPTGDWDYEGANTNVNGPFTFGVDVMEPDNTCGDITADDEDPSDDDD